MSVDGRAVANFVLDFCETTDRGITNLSLQKVVYFCHVWSLVDFHQPLVRHHFEAWQYGPVLQYLYRQFRDFNAKPVTGRATAIDPHSGAGIVVPYSFDADRERALRRVVDFYSRLSAGELVKLSHVIGGPWDEAWNHGGRVNPGMKINDDSIQRFYSKVRAPFLVQ